MGRSIVYIATSLDGFVADRNGGVDWLFDPAEADVGAFMRQVSVCVMGRRTYDQALGFGPWPYSGMRTIVITHRPPPPGSGGIPPNVSFSNRDPADLVAELRRTEAGAIWLMGGPSITEPCRSAGVVDEWSLFVHPIILGEGIPLFTAGSGRTDLRLAGILALPSGMVRLDYRPA